MIESIKNYYNAPSPCIDLCAPLQKYHAFFADQTEESTGFTKVALAIAWIATAFFAYPIFGLLAAVGVAIKAATCQQEAMDPMDMTDLELEAWKAGATVEEWNQAQIDRLKLCFALPLPDSAFHVEEGRSRVFLNDPECVHKVAGVADGTPKVMLDHMMNEAIAQMKPYMNAGKRIELTRIYERGGALDPDCKGRIYVFGCVEGGDSSVVGASPLPAPAPRPRSEPHVPRSVVGNPATAQDPIKMSEAQLGTWGENPSVTPKQWNDVQWGRIDKFIERGVQGDLKGLPRWDGPVMEGDPSSWLSKPWMFPVYNGWCFLLKQDQMGAGPHGIIGLRHAVKAALELATIDGKRMQTRYCYQSTGIDAAVAYVQCRRIKNS